MCYAKGPRCAYHTRDEAKKANAALRVAKAAHDSDPSPDNNDALLAARQNFYEAQIDYTGTPEGRGKMMMQIQRLESEGKDASVYQGLLDKAVERYKNQMRMNALSRQAGTDVRTSSNNPAIKGQRMRMEGHALSQAFDKAIDMGVVEATFKNPEEVYPNGRYPGQWRVTGNGICLVGEPRGGSFHIITMYLDRVVTAPRKDQMETSHGREYAQRYQQAGSRAR